MLIDWWFIDWLFIALRQLRLFFNAESPVEGSKVKRMHGGYGLLAERDFYRAQISSVIRLLFLISYFRDRWLSCLNRQTGKGDRHKHSPDSIARSVNIYLSCYLDVNVSMLSREKLAKQTKWKFPSLELQLQSF